MSRLPYLASPMVCLLTALGTGQPAQADPAALSAWVGYSRCGGCHSDQLSRWTRGPHRNATKSLGARAGDGRCDLCHSTGDSPAGRNLLAGVQCEACHGAGRDYSAADIMADPALARLLGLRDMSTPAARDLVCKNCHDGSTSLQAFDPEKAWKQIRH